MRKGIFIQNGVNVCITKGITSIDQGGIGDVLANSRGRREGGSQLGMHKHPSKNENLNCDNIG